jgi:tetratricopeptide (TPR) repeat protein
VGGTPGSHPAPRRPPAVDASATDDRTAPGWPLQRHVTPTGPAPPHHIRLLDLHRAFPAGQTGGTRLVLTQATYQLQRWLDWLERNPSVAVYGDCSAGSAALAREASARRGPWARIAVDAVPPRDASESGEAAWDEAFGPLLDAFARGTAEDRWHQSHRLGLDHPHHAAVNLAHASACMELARIDEAHTAIERAMAVAPEWEAVHFELGKLRLRSDDTELAAAAFAEAGRLMPSFSAAFGNLGAALGELDRHEEALAALEQALQFDPYGHTVLNNLGAAARDLGRLDDAESAFRLAIGHAPGFVFAHYNLGHTCFLQGKFADAREAYEAGLAADPQPGTRQRCRAALAHAAAGDATRARSYFDRGLEEESDAETRAEIVDESAEVLRALMQLPGADASTLARLLELVESKR